MEEIEKKLIKKAKRWAKYCGKMPGVKAIFLSGSIACGRATEKSDIDFFIIAQHGRIWTARFFVLTGRFGMDGYLDEHHVFDLFSNGMSIGSHGVNHVRWPEISDGELHKELTQDGWRCCWQFLLEGATCLCLNLTALST